MLGTVQPPCYESDSLTLSERMFAVLDLDPIRRAVGTIGAISKLGDQAFQAKLARLAKQAGPDLALFKRRNEYPSGRRAGVLASIGSASYHSASFGEFDQGAQVGAKFMRGFDTTGTCHLALPCSPSSTRRRIKSAGAFGNLSQCKP
jgi:hypothetical protein